jgi:hypothetical protein
MIICQNIWQQQLNVSSNGHEDLWWNLLSF